MLRRSPRILSILIAGAVGLFAQDPPTRVGRLNYVSGSVSFQPGGVDDWVAASVNRPLTVGDQLFADEGARAEVHIPGAAFQLGSRTAFQFLNLDDRTAQVRLSEGTLNVHVRRLEGTLEVDTPNMAYTIQAPGEYRIDTNPDSYETNVTVRSGDGQITSINGAAFGVRAGQQAVISGQDGAQYNVYRAQGGDDFDNWIRTRDEREDRFQSDRYVSTDMVGYEDLDEYGSWESAPGYGQAWVPRGVAADWAPYHNGHWAWVDPWGWTWVDDAPWGFAPFHYGRWAYINRHWGWLPGPVRTAPVYAPALVGWFGVGGGGVQLSVGFGDGVGWFPLGPRDVYVPAYQASPAYVTRINTTNTTVINNTQITNVYNTYRQTGGVPTATYANLRAPNAVFAAPRTALETARPMQQVGRTINASQVSAIRTLAAAPRVAPQQAALLGRTAEARVARPSAQVMNRPVAARVQPPPQPVAFAQRQALMAKNPGRPVTIQQQRQLVQPAARTMPGAPAPVRVVTQAKTVTPQVMNSAPPRAQATQRPGTPAPVPSPVRPGQPPPQRAGAPQPPARPVEPPAAQQRQAPAQATRGVPPAPTPQAPRPGAQANREQPRVQPQPSRPFEPPAAQHGPAQATGQQPRVQPQPGRPAEPPTAQRPAPRPPDRGPAQATREQPRVQPNRPVEPPVVQRTAPPTSRPVEPPTARHPVPQERGPAQATREQSPAPQPHRAEPAAPRPQERAPQPAPRPANPAPRAAQPQQQQRRAEPPPAPHGPPANQEKKPKEERPPV